MTSVLPELAKIQRPKHFYFTKNDIQASLTGNFAD